MIIESFSVLILSPTASRNELDRGSLAAIAMSEIGSDSGSPKPVDFAAPTQQEQDEEPHSEPEQQNADEATSDGGDADPTRDTDEAAPLSEDHDADDAEDGGDASDKDSDLLSEIDEDQFDDFGSGPAPVTIDENVTKTLKAAKRRRVDGAAAKKPKEGKRQKKRARSEEDDVESAGGEPAARRPRKARAAAEARAERREPQQQEQEDENEEDLTPEERRRRALERAMDAAVKGNPNKRRRKKDEVDLEDELDEQIASLKVRMERACVADNDAREAGRPAVHKLKLLPEVTALLNRSSAQDNLLDPETNFLQSIKYFLEPLNDGSLPAYNIQRDIFTALTRLPVEKEALLSSGIGKVVLFYTRSKRPEVGIKRMAERLLGEWSRPVLKRTDDYKKRHVETRDFDYVYVPPSPHSLVASSSLTNPRKISTAPPSSLRDRQPSARSSASPRGPRATAARAPTAAARRRPHSAAASRPTASAPWPPWCAATAPSRRACPPATRWRRAAPSTPRAPASPTTGPSAPAGWRRSGG